MSNKSIHGYQMCTGNDQIQSKFKCLTTSWGVEAYKWFCQQHRFSVHLSILTPVALESSYIKPDSWNLHVAAERVWIASDICLYCWDLVRLPGLILAHIFCLPFLTSVWFPSLLVPPSVRARQSTMNATANLSQSVTLACDADGFPEPTMTWTK